MGGMTRAGAWEGEAGAPAGILRASCLGMMAMERNAGNGRGRRAGHPPAPFQGGGGSPEDIPPSKFSPQISPKDLGYDVLIGRI